MNEKRTHLQNWSKSRTSLRLKNSPSLLEKGLRTEVFCSANTSSKRALFLTFSYSSTIHFSLSFSLCKINFNMKKRLIILSDLWGFEEAVWMHSYQKILNPHFEIEYFDSRMLVDLDLSDNSEGLIHARFVNGGIDRGVYKLGLQEKETIIVLAFSVGGVIAWKAGLKGLNISTLYAISSTRLRYEKEKPDCKCILYFGANDRYKPDVEWFRDLELDLNLIPDQEHELYQDEEFAKNLCRKIIEEQVEAQNQLIN